MLVLPHFARCPPHRRRTVLTLLLPDWSSDAEYAYSYKELDTVNKALLEAQAADNAEIAARLANGFPESANAPPRMFSDMWRIANAYWRTGRRWAYLVSIASSTDGSIYPRRPAKSTKSPDMP